MTWPYIHSAVSESYECRDEDGVRSIVFMVIEKNVKIIN